jgi:hypothetical protein
MSGKTKGSAFERKVCSALSLWVTKGQKRDVFWRSSMSGGRATIHVGKGGINRQAGDICSVAPEGHVLTDAVFIECKHYKNLQFASFIFCNTGPLSKFWTKLVQQASQHKRRPMLIAKQNHLPIIVITAFGDPLGAYPGIAISLPGRTAFTMTLFEDFLRNDPPVRVPKKSIPRKK